MIKDLEKTKHYTTQAEKICNNLIKYIPENVKLIEPFVGDGDLITLFPNHQWEKYDIEDKEGSVQQDTLKNPPNYSSNWVITNPPYLAKNKATNKEIFNLYNTDDLYKASLLSILDCEGGILIIPTNFFTDERSYNIRKKFLNHFNILELNIFTEPVFESTTYSVCSFAFSRKENKAENQIFKTNILPKGETIKLQINPNTGYRIAGDFYETLSNIKNLFGRLTYKKTKDFSTNIKLYAIDTREKRIRVEYDKNLFIGKDCDRTYATFICKKPLTEEQQKILIYYFNKELEDFRAKYKDVPMTNYRDYNRKRISFTFAYQLMSKIYYQYIEK